MRHPEAVERLARNNIDNPAMHDTAEETLDSLAAEAARYTAHNSTAGDRDADRLDRLRLLIHEVTAGPLDRQARLALLWLLKRPMAANGVI